MRRRRVGIRLVEGVSHADAFNRLLRDAVHHHGCGNARHLEYGRQNVDYVMELPADSARILDVTGPGDGHALARTTEEGGNLLGPFVRSVESPGPWHGEVVIGLVGAPDVIEI